MKYQTAVGFSRFLRKAVLRKQLHPMLPSIYPQSLPWVVTTRSSSFLSPDMPNVLAVEHLRRRFEETANQEGIFPLLTEEQTESFQKRVKWEPGDRQAAVLVLLCNVEGQPAILFTKRAAHLNQHAAELSFPGGHVEETETCADAALRETCEELLPPDGFLENVQVIGRTSTLPSIRGTPVTAILAVLPHEELKDIHEIFPGDPNEVDQVFSMSIYDLVRNEGSHVIENSRFGGTHAPTFASPYGKIWGLTAFILRPMLHQIFKPVYFSGASVEGKEESAASSAKL